MDKVLLRYFSAVLGIYLILTMLPFPFNYIPTLHPMLASCSHIMNQMATWVGMHILNLQEIPQTILTGSSDTLLNYLTQLTYLIFSLFFAAIILFSSPAEYIYIRTKPYITLLLRYWVAANLVIYGISKVLPVQMPPLNLIQLVQTYGDSSPMGVLWKFMGLSPYYQSVVGLVELIAGVFLLFRGTYFLGLILGAFAFTQVFLLNLFFDVPVKLDSSHYLLVLIYLFSPYIKPLLVFFFQQKLNPLFTTKKLRVFSIIFKYLFIAYCFFIAIFINYREFKKDFLEPIPPFYGIYEVNKFTLDNKVIEPLLTNKERWQYVIFDKQDKLYIHKISRKGPRFKTSFDYNNKKITLTGNGMPDPVDWQYDALNAKEMVLTGVYNNQSFEAHIRKVDLSEFKLWDSKFNWIQEYPHNR